MAIYSGFSHWKWWFSMAMLNYQKVVLISRWRPGIHVVHRSSYIFIDLHRGRGNGDDTEIEKLQRMYDMYDNVWHLSFPWEKWGKDENRRLLWLSIPFVTVFPSPLTQLVVMMRIAKRYSWNLRKTCLWHDLDTRQQRWVSGSYHFWSTDTSDLCVRRLLCVNTPGILSHEQIMYPLYIPRCWNHEHIYTYIHILSIT